jgi:antitoxin component HigA of HigAB toxin-antitoxin module
MEPIQSKEEYAAVMGRIYVLCDIDPMPETEEGRELTVLVDRAMVYEREHYPLAPKRPDPA